MRRTLLLAAILLTTCGARPAFAWGCQGHRTVAILAERLIGTTRVQAMRAVLAASPIAPGLQRFCFPIQPDPVVDQATWADDVRDAVTGEWHFIDYPRSVDAHQTDFKRFCAGGNCVIDAIVDQFKRLTTSSDKTERANALRFVIHFVGDVHQPMHAITNGDRGGNCLPITYFGEAPAPKGTGFTPNLHHIWDTGTIVRFMKAQHLANNDALAQRIINDGLLAKTVKASAPTTPAVLGWARESNALAKDGYSKLATAVPEEPVLTQVLRTCAGNNNVGARMLQLHESVDAPYEASSLPVIEKQLALAGQRLAAVLKAAFP